MKRVFLFFAIIFGITGWTWILKAQFNPPIKKYKVEQTVEWWSKALNSIESVKTNLKLSDLPSKNVTFLSDSLLTPIQIEITKQVQDQINAEIKKDTLSKPKKN